MATLRVRIDADRVRPRIVAIGLLDAALERLEPQPLEVAVRGVGLLRPGLAVHRERLVAILDDVASDADDALDEVLRRIQRIAEHDDVTAARVVQRDDRLLDHRQPDAVDELVDEDEIADLERRPHRRRWNLERLREKRAQQEYDQQHRKERLRVFDPHRLARARRPPAR